MGESGAKGCEVVVSGKLRGQRAKAMKFVDGLMIHSGDPVNEYVDMACRHVLLRQGVLGIKCGIFSGENHVALGSSRKDWSQETSARSCFYCGTQGRDPASQPLLRDQGC